MMLRLFIIIISSCTISGGTPYCTQYTGGPGPDDPALPQLPTKYQAVIEGTFMDMNYSITAHEYFDGPGNRIALNILRKGTQLFSLFDYANNQAVFITGTECQVQNSTNHGVPHMINTVSAINFLNSSGQQYLGETQIRGITVDHWQSCLYWPNARANFTLDFYFTAQNWTDPITRQQIPVQAHVKGVQISENGTVLNIEHVYDYVDFRTSISDPEVFETPAGIVCPGRPTKPIPPVPDYFHSRLESTTVGDSGVYEVEYWYDKTKNIVRYDQRLKYPLAGLQTDTPVSVIDDYNYGLKYVKDKTTGACHVMKISKSDPEDFTVESAKSSDSLWFKLWLKGPREFLGTNSNFTYTGKRVVRGLQCDLYSGYHNFGLLYASYQYYVLSEGYSMYPNDDPSTSQRVPIQLVITNQTLGVGVVQSITQFSTAQPKMSAFDVSSCYPYNSSVHLKVRFQGSYKTGLRDGIINSAHSSLSTAMSVSPLRVQDVIMDYDNSFIYISATLLDRSPYLKQFTFISNYTSYTMNDKAFPSSLIPTMSDCATACVLYTNFSCNSFDYCPTDPNNACRLSRNHTSGNKTPGATATQCQHYGRTVDAPNHPEINSSSAYTNLQLAIYSGGVRFQASLPYISTPFVYTAVESSVSYGMLYMKNRPTFSGQFSYHLEWKLPVLQQILNAHIWYDYEYKLVRYDVLNNGPVSKIHDYNSGLSYVIHKDTQQCVVSPISNSSFDVVTPKHENITGYVLRLKNPLEFFDVSQKFTYIGQSTIRNILCDVYESTEPFDLGEGKRNAVVQFFFMARDWKELSENSGLAVPSQPLSLQITALDSTDTIRYDISDFNEQHPDLKNFNLLPCFPANKQRHILLEFNQTYHPALDSHLSDFIKNVQIQLSVLTGVSPLRFQKPDVSYDGPNTFYIATMVEQSPSLLDFTSVSKLKGIYTMDATYVDIINDEACAEICRNISAFTCLSFDYCSTTKLCQLSKRHNMDGKLLRPNADCNHYSKTVDSISRPEPTVDKAITILQNKIAEGKFVVNVQLDDGSVVKYQATYIGGNILRYEYGKQSSQTLAHFNRIKNEALHILNNPTVRFVRYFPYSVDDCADKCRTHPTFDCESFSYCADMGLCLLSDVHPAENASAFESSPICDLYSIINSNFGADPQVSYSKIRNTKIFGSESYLRGTKVFLEVKLERDKLFNLPTQYLWSRKYSDRYVSYPGDIAVDVDAQKYTNVESVDVCAKRCTRSTNHTCRSFDFCPVTSTCYLSEKHVLDMPTVQKPQALNSVCTHYSRKYLFDFSVTANKTFTGLTPIVFTNVSLANCSKLCVENEGYMCGVFSYCGKTTTCSIYSSQTKYIQSKIIPSTTCDLYTRTYINTEVHPYFTPEKQTSNQSGGPFSGGTMAAVAFGTLIPGMVLGAAILYFTKTKALLDRKHEHEMTIIDKEQVEHE